MLPMEMKFGVEESTPERQMPLQDEKSK